MAAALSKRNRDELLHKLLGAEIAELVGPRAEDIWYDLRGVTIRGSGSPQSLDLSRLVLDYAHIEDVNAKNLACKGCLLRGAVFIRSELQHADFTDAHLEDSRFLDSSLKDSVLSGAQFGSSTVFNGTSIEGAKFDSYNGHTKFEFRGGSARRASFERVNLTGALFTDIDLSETAFYMATLRDARFHRVRLGETDFGEADLRNASFTNSKVNSIVRLVGTQLQGAQLGDLDISKLDLAFLRIQVAEFRLGEECVADQDRRDPREDRNALHMKQSLYRRAETLYRQMAHKFEAAMAIPEFDWCYCNGPLCSPPEKAESVTIISPDSSVRMRISDS